MSLLPSFIFRVCPDNVAEPTRTRQVEPNEYTIFKAVNRESLRIVKSNAGITKEDLMKAAKCAKFNDFKVYRHANCTESTVVKETELPIKANVYLTQVAPRSMTVQQMTKVFHICESTSVAPRRGRPPTAQPSPIFSEAAGMTDGQKRTVRSALHSFKNAIKEMKKAVKELERLS